MTDPVVAYSVKEVLTRIEHKLDAQGEAIHKLELSAAAVTAVSRARTALWAAVVSGATAAAALIVAFAHH